MSRYRGAVILVLAAPVVVFIDFVLFSNHAYSPIIGSDTGAYTSISYVPVRLERGAFSASIARIFMFPVLPPLDALSSHRAIAAEGPPPKDRLGRWFWNGGQSRAAANSMFLQLACLNAVFWVGAIGLFLRFTGRRAPRVAA